MDGAFIASEMSKGRYDTHTNHCGICDQSMAHRARRSPQRSDLLVIQVLLVAALAFRINCVHNLRPTAAFGCFQINHHRARNEDAAWSHPLHASTLAGADGLSRYYRNILSRNSDQQRFVTGKYPVIVTVEENPTRKWLNRGREGRNAAISTSQLLANGTSIEKSVASYDRFQWLAEDERQELHNRYATVSLQLLAEIHIPKPGYVNVLPGDGAGSSAEVLRQVGHSGGWKWNRNKELFHKLEDLRWRGPYRDRLWTTGFTLTGRKGIVRSVDVDSGHIESVNARSEAMTLWPNEVNSVPSQLIRNSNSKQGNTNFIDDALLISDGFLVPGKDRGGIYIVLNPGNPDSEWTLSLTDQSDRWFYHRAVWVDVTADGRMSILTSRAKLRGEVKANGNTSANEASRPKNGQLVWLEMPSPYKFDEETGTPLEEDGTAFDPFSARHLPWKEHVLATGPDVMFNVADLDTTDDTIEVIASQFFDKKVTLRSIQRGPIPKVTFSRIIDDRCGAAFGCILADLDCNACPIDRQVVDSGSTVKSLKTGDSFSHVLVTSHECDYVETESNGAATSSSSRASTIGISETLEGGSLFAYRVPEGKGSWKTEPWIRSTVATGFKVKPQIWNVINPGAPGFVYTFHARKEDACSGKRPMIAVAGDCAESAYIFRPANSNPSDSSNLRVDVGAQYKLMCEIKCAATVGSIGVGYADLLEEEQESGYAKIYVPCYEKDKILVFAMGSGEDTEDDDGW